MGKIQQIEWSSIEDQLISIVDFKLFEKFQSLAKHLANFQQSYVYEIEFNFGEFVHENGQLQLSKLEGIDDRIMTDLNYSMDPLGIVITNSIEVFMSNEKTNFPLNNIKRGDLFGTYGTSNYLSGFENKYKSIWKSRAGRISTKLNYVDIFAKQYSRLRSNLGLEKYRDIKKTDYNKPNNYDKLVIVDTEYDKLKMLYDVLEPDWKAKLIIFPKQWINHENCEDNNHIKLCYSVFQKAWLQETETRQITMLSLFEKFPYATILDSIISGQGFVFFPIDPIHQTNSTDRALTNILSILHSEIIKIKPNLIPVAFELGKFKENIQHQYGIFSISERTIPSQPIYTKSPSFEFFNSDNPHDFVNHNEDIWFYGLNSNEEGQSGTAKKKFMTHRRFKLDVLKFQEDEQLANMRICNLLNMAIIISNPDYKNEKK